MADQGGYGYGKKPWWVWLVVYLIVGGLIYYAVYYFYFAKKGGYNYNAPTNQNQSPY